MNLNEQIYFYQKKENYFSQIKYKCKCSHTVIIPVFKDKTLCDWCGHYVYRDKCAEFKDKLKQKMNEIK